MTMKMARDNKTPRYNLSKYIHNVLQQCIPVYNYGWVGWWMDSIKGCEYIITRFLLELGTARLITIHPSISH